MRRSAVILCSLLAACASAGKPGIGDDDDQPGDGGIDGPLFPDAPPDPRRGWVDLGSPPAALAGDVSSPRLAMWNNAPVVAYSADNHVRVMAYESDTTWTAIGAPLRHSTATNAVTYDPTVVVGSDGLAVVWPEWSAGAMASAVRRATGGTWVPPPGAGVLGTTGAYSFVPHSTAAVDADGAMWIAYAETTDINAPMRISVVSLLGANVVQRGSAISATNTNTHAIAPNLASGGGSQFMAWTEDGVRLAKHNPATGVWDPFGGSPIVVAGRPVGNHHSPHVAVDSAGRPIIAFASSDGTETGIYVGRWDGAGWTYWQQMLQAAPGQVGGSTTFPNVYDLVTRGPDVVYVAWSEVDSSAQDGIYVHRCTPAGCLPVGRGRLEATAGATPGYGPRLAIDPFGRPLVTWTEDDAAGVSRVHVWRYHGDPDGP
ncbi:MAG: hypothetical protein WKG01_34300 [Kofleriaceae bacterium]